MGPEVGPVVGPRDLRWDLSWDHGTAGPGAGPVRRKLLRGVGGGDKGQFSECTESVCDDEDGGGSEQGEDDPSKPILPSIQAFVREQPSTAVLNNASDLAEPGTVGLANLADVRLNSVT